MTGLYAKFVADEAGKDKLANHKTSVPVDAADCLLTQLFLLVMHLAAASRSVREARLPFYRSPQLGAAFRAAARQAADRAGGVREDEPRDYPEAILEPLRVWADRAKQDIGMMLLLPDLQMPLFDC